VRAPVPYCLVSILFLGYLELGDPRPSEHCLKVMTPITTIASPQYVSISIRCTTGFQEFSV
jgi:hypothetical protein